MTPQETRIKVAEACGKIIKLRKFKMGSRRVSVCPKCLGDELNIWDSGYSSFNCGGVDCSCGYKLKLSNLSCFPTDEIITQWNDHCKGAGDIPNYPEDLNACAEMERTLTIEESRKYEEVLEVVVNEAFIRNESCFVFPAWHATALQRCEAFLKVKGLWIDGGKV